MSTLTVPEKIVITVPSDAEPLLRDDALAHELNRLKEAEQAQRDLKQELARLRDLARFD